MSEMMATMSSSNANSIAIPATIITRATTGKKEKNIALRSILSGSVAGMASVVLFHPVDVLRTKMQASSSLSSLSVSPSAANKGSGATIESSATPASRPAAVLMHTFRNGGFRALYTGMSPVLGAQACYKATIFTVNNLSRRALIDHKTNERQKTGIFTSYTPILADTWFCGAMGGFINGAVFVAPVEFVRNQQIAQHILLSTKEGASSSTMASKMKSPLEFVKKTLRKHGIFSLWRGAGVTMIRDSLGWGSFFVCYEVAKSNLGPHLGDRDSTATMLVSGACAGWGYWVFALPLDTLKTLVQTGNATSAWDTAMLSIQRNGVTATMGQLVREWRLAFGRGGPAAAVTLLTYATVFEQTGTVLDGANNGQ